MKILKWLDDCIEEQSKDMKRSLAFVMKAYKKGNTDSSELSHHLFNIKRLEEENALMSLIREMIEEELEIKTKKN